MRGKLNRGPIARPIPRLIPAHAGKTASRKKGIGSRAAHPRACGENQCEARERYPLLGSSPRMRGKPYAPAPAGDGTRLIPAHAGKTPSITPSPLRSPAHPRACGENLWIADSALRNPGSSPRMRGKPLPGATNGLGPRLIPAHAGKTMTTKSNTCQAGAHPRACGENIRGRIAETTVRGSSPRMRGKH